MTTTTRTSYFAATDVGISIVRLTTSFSTSVKPAMNMTSAYETKHVRPKNEKLRVLRWSKILRSLVRAPDMPIESKNLAVAIISLVCYCSSQRLQPRKSNCISRLTLRLPVLSALFRSLRWREWYQKGGQRSACKWVCTLSLISPQHRLVGLAAITLS
jgi:hypothetical protein